MTLLRSPFVTFVTFVDCFVLLRLVVVVGYVVTVTYGFIYVYGYRFVTFVCSAGAPHVRSLRCYVPHVTLRSLRYVCVLRLVDYVRSPLRFTVGLRVVTVVGYVDYYV